MSIVSDGCNDSCVHKDVCMHKKAYSDTIYHLNEMLKRDVGDSIFTLQLICPFYKTFQLIKDAPDISVLSAFTRGNSFQYDMETYPK